MNDCALCDAIDTGSAILWNALAVALPDAYPLNPGHHLVTTRRHEPDFFDLTPDELVDAFRLVHELHPYIDARWHPDGFNVGVNVGDAAGQTIGHVHIHVIPRYAGDCLDPRGGIRLLIPDRARYWEASP